MIDLIEEGTIGSPFIVLSDKLVDKFGTNWNRYVGNSSIFTADIGKPYYHLQHEPFWRLIGHDKENDPQEGEAVNYSLKSLRERFRCAIIDQSLFEYLQQPDNRADLRVVLITEYLINHPPYQC